MPRRCISKRACFVNSIDMGSLFVYLIHCGFQFPSLVHLGDDVTAADEFAIDVELGDGGPVGVILDALPDLRIGQYIHRGEFRPHRFEELHRLGREPALRRLRDPFHKENDGVGGHEIFDLLLCVVHAYPVTTLPPSVKV